MISRSRLHFLGRAKAVSGNRQHSIELCWAGSNHAGDLLKDPLTQQERNDLRWYLEEYWKWPFEGFAQHAKEVEELLPELGKRLYESVFGSRQADRIVQKWLDTVGDHQISIISDLPHALSLPWELLHSEQGYLVMRTQEPVSILRRLHKSESTTAATSFEPPLRVLLVTARPQGTGFIDHAASRVSCSTRYRSR